MKKVRNIVTYILASILSVLLIGYIIINTFSSTVISKKFILSKLEKIGYYEKTVELVNSNFEKYIQQSGLEENVIKGIITKEKVKEDTKIILTNIYDGTDEKILTSDILEKLNDKIKESLKDRTLTSSEEKAISQFVEKICDEYKATILDTGYEDKAYDIIHKVSNKITNIEKILLVSISIVFGIIFLINVKKLYRMINAFGISLLGSGIVLLIVKIYIDVKISINQITIFNELFSEVLRSILNDIIAQIGKYGVLFIIVGILFIICSNLLHNIKKYGLKERVQKYNN